MFRHSRAARSIAPVQPIAGTPPRISTPPIASRIPLPAALRAPEFRKFWAGNGFLFFARVMDVAMDGVIQWALKAGIRTLDFGTFTKAMVPNWGLGRFKEKFGARGVLRNTLELTL